HLNFLADPEDVRRMLEALRLAYGLATSPPLGDQVSEIMFPDPETVADDAKLTAYMRQSCFTGYHPVGTCRMGPDGDPGAVVDQRLAVRGTEGLWIADASVLPKAPTGFTNLTVYMVGERAADWLGEEAAVGAAAGAAAGA